jgi:hypothetical protein
VVEEHAVDTTTATYSLSSRSSRSSTSAPIATLTTPTGVIDTRTLGPGAGSRDVELLEVSAARVSNPVADVLNVTAVGDRSDWPRPPEPGRAGDFVPKI